MTAVLFSGMSKGLHAPKTAREIKKNTFFMLKSNEFCYKIVLE